MSDEAVNPDDAVRLFGDPRSKLTERGPDRRTPEGDAFPANVTPHPVALDGIHSNGRRDDIAPTAFAVIGLLVFGGAVVAGALILYNAKSVGAFRNPWDSTRVAIGITVLAVGVVQALILLGLARVLSYLAAERRRHN